MLPALDETVVVFDLDDTIYPEADYKKSGVHEVCTWIQKYYEKSIAEQLNLLLAEGEHDFLSAACRLAELAAPVKENLLWIYRLHFPNIQLSASAKKTIQYFETFSRVAILTDGRSITQRLKLKALGLSHLPAFISEDYNSVKPENLRFKQIMNELPAKYYVYIADNPAKDFVAPNSLGWMTIGLKGTAINIYPQEIEGLSSNHLPMLWIDNLSELLI